MLLDLLSSSNVISFNIKVAQLLGLNSAIYLSEVMAINEKALRKNKIYDEEYFTLDRKYLTTRTTLTVAEQKKIETTLEELQIIERHKTMEDTFFIDINLLANMIGGEIEKACLSKIEKIAKVKTKEEKAEGKLIGMRKNARNAITATVPELRTAYYEWIERALERYNRLTVATVKKIQQQVDDFAQHDLEVALAIIKGNDKGYDTMQYSIEAYEKLHPSNKKESTVAERKLDISNEVI